MTQISTIRGLFEALGGLQSVADMAGVSLTAVYMVLHRGSIPHRWRMTLYREATSRKISYDPALLGMQAAQ